MRAQLLFDVMASVGRQKAADMPAQHRHIMIVLANFADEEGVAWPSKERLVEETGICHGSLCAAIKELATAGWLVNLNRGGGRSTTRYQVKTSGLPISPRKRLVPSGQALQNLDSSPPESGGLLSTSRTPAIHPVDGSRPGSPDHFLIDPPIDPPIETTQQPPQRASAAGREAGVLVLAPVDPPSSAPVPRRRAPSALSSLQRYAAAYAAGIVDVAGGVFAPPTDSHAQYVFRKVLPVHAISSTGKPLGGVELEAWIRSSAADYRRARADRGQFEGGFKPSKWQEWLESGRVSLARSPPYGSPRKGTPRQESPPDQVAALKEMF